MFSHQSMNSLNLTQKMVKNNKDNSDINKMYLNVIDLLNIRKIQYFICFLIKNIFVIVKLHQKQSLTSELNFSLNILYLEFYDDYDSNIMNKYD